ncbi:plasmid segregation protein ParM [Escherichia coli]|nr:plasmid segregation protein ParM [Escherichia coli]CAD5744223.1 plasmid segregation protein ParM [Escherichia coli]
MNSFRHNWKVEGLGSSRTYNYLLDGRKYTYDPVSEDAISTTHIEYQYSDTNVLAVHHALLNSGIEPQEIDLTVTLPISEFYTADCQKNTLCGGSHFMARKLEELGHFPKLDTNLAGPVRQSIYTKTGTPVRQVGRLGPGVTVPEKQLCSDLRSGKQAGQNSLGTDNTTADLRSITANKPV